VLAGLLEGFIFEDHMKSEMLHDGVLDRRIQPGLSCPGGPGGITGARSTGNESDKGIRTSSSTQHPVVTSPFVLHLIFKVVLPNPTKSMLNTVYK
jgi:hypothetical protein